MKTFRTVASLAASAAMALLCACASNSDSEQMPPFAGSRAGLNAGKAGKGAGGLDGQGLDGAGLGGQAGDISLGPGGIGSPGAGGFGAPGRDGATLAPGAREGNWIPDESKRFTPVYFAFDQYRIGTSEVAKVEAAAAYMAKNPSVGLIIEGHCDERGSAEYNMGLGERRALAIREHLVSLGVDGNRLQTISYGAERPADPGHDESAWAKNRRGEMVPAIIQ